MKKEFKEEPTGKNGWTKFIQPHSKGYKFCCCACGLVHDFEFRSFNFKPQFRVRVNTRSTGQIRRWMKIEAKNGLAL